MKATVPWAFFPLPFLIRHAIRTETVSWRISKAKCNFHVGTVRRNAMYFLIEYSSGWRPPKNRSNTRPNSISPFRRGLPLKRNLITADELTQNILIPLFTVLLGGRPSFPLLGGGGYYYNWKSNGRKLSSPGNIITRMIENVEFLIRNFTFRFPPLKICNVLTSLQTQPSLSP